jgi:hypothetical protein
VSRHDAGNTSTGVLGITKVRGHVFAGGVSLLHDFAPRLTLGGEYIATLRVGGQIVFAVDFPDKVRPPPRPRLFH